MKNKSEVRKYIMSLINTQNEIVRSREDVLGVINLCIENYGSQKAFAEQCGISKQYMNDIVQGRRNIPKQVLNRLGFVKKEIYIFRL